MNYSQLYINNQEVSLSDVDLIALNYAINDLTELAKRDTHGSRTIILPPTNTNHEIFGYVFEINGIGEFDTNKRANMLFLTNGLPQMEGFAQLTRYVEFGKDAGYHLLLTGGNSDWVTEIGDAELTDLDLSEYDHIWNGANIINSWDNTEGYVYPLIDYGKFGGFTDATNLQVTDFYPAVFVYTLIKKIFDRIGYTIAGSFFSDVQHRAQILPFASKDFQHSVEWKEERDFVGSSSSLATYTGGAYLKISFTTITGNVAGYWNNALMRFVATEALTVTFKIDATVSGGASGAVFHIELFKNNAATGTELTFTIPATPLPNYKMQGDLSITLAVGDYVDIRYGSSSTMVINDIAVTSDISRNYVSGALIRVNDFIPKMKQVDLIRSQYQLWALMVDANPQLKTIKKDTYKDFYKKPDPLFEDSYNDWSAKLDLTGAIEHIYLAEGYGKNNLFKWKQEEADIDIKNYMLTSPYPFSTGFGNGSFSIANDFLPKEVVISDLPFASTWMKDSFSGLLHIPNIKRYTQTDDLFGIPIYEATENPLPRLLIYAGKTLVNEISSYSNLTFEGSPITEIPYCYFWKREYGNDLDTFDVNLYFDNENVEFGTTVLEKYYPELINIVKKFRLLKCWASLNEIDINSLDFGKPIYLDYFAAWFTLNKIEDYQPGKNHESALIQLLRLP